MHGKRVIVSLPFPLFDKSVPELEIRNAVLGRFGLGGEAKDETLPTIRDQIISIAKREGAEIFDPRKSLCPNEQCITQINGISIYKDQSHVTTNQIGLLETDVLHALLK